MPVLVIAVVCLIIFIAMGVLAVSAVRNELHEKGSESESNQKAVTKAG